MRKILLVASVLSFNIVAAQQSTNQVRLVPTNPRATLRSIPKPLPAGNENRAPGGTPTPASAPGSSSGNLKTSGLRMTEAILGTTMYDVQTNRAMGDRIVNNPDGTLSAVWTTLCPPDATAERGTGYNYFDGTAWLPADCHRIEPTQRTGFTNIAVTATGKELVMAHSSTAPGMLLTYRPTKGTGPWIEDPTALGNFADDTWAKMAVGGSDGQTVHAIWNATGISTTFQKCGQLGPVVYSRSTDNGVTWPVLRACIDLIDSSFYFAFSADDYAIDAQGNNVAILVSDWTTDLILLKSTDNGDTWTKQILYQFPIPQYDDVNNVIDTNSDGIVDTIPVPNGDGRVVFDNNGMIHVVYSEVFILDDDITGGVSYYPTVDGGIWHWDESMGNNPAVMIAAAEDLNSDGILGLPVINPSGYGAGIYVGGLSLQPTIGFDAENNMFVTYATFDESADTLLGAGHRHIFVIASYDGGQTWTTPLDIVPTAAEGGDGEFQEAIYPSMAQVVDDEIHIVYQRDYGPGVFVNNTDPAESGWNAEPSEIVYAGVIKGELTSAGTIGIASLKVSQNIPNPATDQTIIRVTLPVNADVTVDVYDVLGQKVLGIPSSNYSGGEHSFKIDCSRLNQGVYFYEVSAGNEKVTKKMVIE